MLWRKSSNCNLEQSSQGNTPTNGAEILHKLQCQHGQINTLKHYKELC